MRRELEVLLSSKKISRNLYRERLAKLEWAFARTQNIRQLLHEREILASKRTDLGLPVPGYLSHEELAYTDQMLGERLARVRELFHKTKGLKIGAQQALSGQMTGLKGTLRLAKFKKEFEECQQDKLLVAKEVLEQNLRVTKLSASLKGRFKDGLENNVSSLVKIYEHMAHINNRTLRLKESLQREMARIGEMERFLRPTNRGTIPDSQHTPDAEAINRAAEIAMSDQLDPVAYARKRLAIAYEFAALAKENTNESRSIQGASRQGGEKESHVAPPADVAVNPTREGSGIVY